MGFTIIELLIVMALIGVAAGIGIPITGSFLAQSRINSIDDEIVGLLREAQTLSMTKKDSVSWGVCLQADQASLKPIDCSTQAVATVNYPDSIQITGPDNIYFSQGWGIPNEQGSVEINGFGVTKEIEVNIAGSIFVR